MVALLDLNDTYEVDPAIGQWWSSKPAALSGIARTWFEVMKSCGADVRESLHNGYPAACIGLYPFAYVDAFTSHVNVGFYYGAFLDDPREILLGTGKRMRHVKLRLDASVDSAVLNSLIESAYKDLKRRVAEL